MHKVVVQHYDNVYMHIAQFQQEDLAPKPGNMPMDRPCFWYSCIFPWMQFGSHNLELATIYQALLKS